MALYGITDRSQILDAQAVKAACNMIDSAAEDFATAAKKLEEAKNEIGGKAMKVDGQTMEDSYKIVKEGLENVKTNINAYTQQVINTANAISTAQQNEYLDYIEQQKRQANQ
ncbi:MAG: hypothetical protein Q4E69_00440 [Bacilli bacterium]|nr:hypothetical protein [Bacilli bacterium]